MSPLLACDAVSVDYGEVRAIDSLSLEVGEGETLALLGPSGSGKSTLLYAIAGFLDVSEGTIALSGEVVSTLASSVSPERRAVGFVFQNYALWPHLSAVEIVAYPMRRSGMTRGTAESAAMELLDMMGISHLASRKPGELSGGQQQRVGLARALARSGRLFLLDEPTAHLDASLRAAVQAEIARRRRETGAAAIYATHDSAEALAVADRVALLRSGSIVQVGTPQEVYERSADLWAARLTGPATVLEAEVVATGRGKVEVSLGDDRLVAETDLSDTGGSVMVLVRPEWVRPNGSLRGVVTETWFRGPHTDYEIETAVGSLLARVPGPPRWAAGETSGWSVERGWVPDTGNDA